MTEEKQKRTFLKAETVFLDKIVYKSRYLVSAILKSSLVGTLVALVHDVAVDVSNPRHACGDTCSVRLAKSSFYPVIIKSLPWDDIRASRIVKHGLKVFFNIIITVGLMIFGIKLHLCFLPLPQDEI